MVSIKEHVARHRRSLRSIVLLGVLLGCVALAYMLVDYKSSDANEGADVMAEIHRKGLRAYLPSVPTEDYYLLTVNGEPFGWKAEYVSPDKNGGYSGGCVMVQYTSPDATEIAVSRWKLDKTATVGKYVSQYSIKGPAPDDVFITEISIRDGVVTLSQSLHGSSVESSSKQPANYIPEDLRQAAMFKLIEKKTNACFRTIYDAIISENSAVPFVTLMCRYDGKEDGFYRLSVRSGVDGSAIEDSIYYFDTAGKIVRVTSPDGKAEILTTRQSLENAFPNAMKTLRTLTK